MPLHSPYFVEVGLGQSTLRPAVLAKVPEVLLVSDWSSWFIPSSGRRSLGGTVPLPVGPSTGVNRLSGSDWLKMRDRGRSGLLIG